MSVALTSLSHGAGCGCKLPAAALAPIVEALRAPADPRLLVGYATGDDAAVFRVRDDLALVQTVDFFTPVVDDPFDFGRIAAANAVSDVYAMGGTPLTALNLVAFPLEQLGAEVLARVLAGGMAMATQAGFAIVGGHSIDDPEPKYGLAVTGTVDPEQMLTNARALAGEALVLTKPLGTGAISTAATNGAGDAGGLARAVEVMCELNDRASRQALAAGARAVTDVTGFGLLGHLHTLALQSGLGAEVHAERIPCIDEARELLGQDSAISGGTRRNRAHAEGFTQFADSVPEWRRRLACDATTSGGLLVAVASERAGEIDGEVIGRTTWGKPGTIVVV